VLSLGSVLTFAGDGPGVDIDDVRARTRAGIGWHRNEGLGQVLVAPSFLTAASPAELASATTPAEHDTARDTAPDLAAEDMLAAWLQRRAEVEYQADARTEEMMEIAGRLGRHVSRSQWGEVRALAIQALRAGWSDQVFLDALDDLVSTGVGKLSVRWGRRLRRDRSVGQALHAELASVEPGSVARSALDLATYAARTGGGAL
jgi:hypothetical protein